MRFTKQQDPVFGEILGAREESRRGWVARCIRAGLAVAGSCAVVGATEAWGEGKTEAKRSGRLVAPMGIQQLTTRSKLVLEVAGELRIEEPDPKKEGKVRKAEVKSKSTLDYFEAIHYTKELPSSASRRYVTAECENWVAGSASTQRLRPDCLQTEVMLHEGCWEQYCPAQPLDAREVELLRSPINSLALELLFPAEPAKADQPWTISREVAKELFNLEAVHQSTLTARVSKVEKGVATIELSGDLEATANSVPTTLKITGNIQGRLGRQCAYVNWLGLSIREEREISQLEPGFAITARISLLRAEVDEQDMPAAPSAVSKVAGSNDADGRWLVRLQSIPGRYTLLADRRWRTYVDGGEEAILRMIENNSIIAQCNITQLPKMEAGTQLTLEGFQAEIKKSLGDGFMAFDEASERATSAKLRLLRVVVHGQMQEVPIQWIFCHLSDDSGRRVALEFTFGGNLAERFAAADEQMTSSFEFAPAVDEAASPTPARLSNAPGSTRK